jgi:hypothetical protein
MFFRPRASTALSSRLAVVVGCFSSLSSNPAVMTAAGGSQGEARGLFLWGVVHAAMVIFFDQVNETTRIKPFDSIARHHAS